MLWSPADCIRAYVTLWRRILNLTSLDREAFETRLPQLEELFRSSFGRNLPSQFLHWRYLENPLATEILTCVEQGDSGLAASYSVSPAFLNVSGSWVKAALSMTTMTSPAYAGRGLFTKLAEQLYLRMADLGYQVVWGFPNAQSHRGFVSRLKWFDIYEIPTMTLALADRPAQRFEAALDSGFGLDYSFIGTQQGEVSLSKDRTYLQWRYGRHPSNRYECLVVRSGATVTSFCVIKKFGATLDLIDMQAANADECGYLLNQVVAFGQKHELASISCWAPRHHFMHPLCEKLGFVNRQPVTYLGARILGYDSALRSRLAGYSAWYLQMGDSDVY